MIATAMALIVAKENLARRFALALNRLNQDGGPIGLAVSGGADSLGMMVLADSAIPSGFQVATVNHGIRPEADDECALVARECARRNIPCTILNVELAAGNLQQEARKARYHAMGQWAADKGLDAIATAHHAQDQRETFLMRLSRGSGVAGLAGIREKMQLVGVPVPLIRPVLGCSREELRALVDEAGIDPVNDPSNGDDAYDRVRLRKAIDLNAEFAGQYLDPRGISVSASNLADADRAMEWASNREWDECVTYDEQAIRYKPTTGIPRAIMLRIAERAISHLGGTVRGKALAELHRSLAQGSGQSNLGGVLILVERGEWRFQPEPKRSAGRA